MKFIKTLLLVVPICAIFCICGSGLTSCTKTKTIHDTTTVTIHDTTTVIIKDTAFINDTIMSNITKGLIAYYNFNGGNLNDSS